MTITPGIQHTGGSKFSEIRDSFAKARADQHINFSSRQGLHTDPKLEASSAFVERFRSQTELDARATLREAAIQKIRDAIDDEYGPGMGQKVFDDVSKGAVVELTKKDLDHLDSAAKRLRAEGEMPANHRLGAVSIETLYKTGSGVVADRKVLTEADENAARDRMRDAVLSLPPNAKADQCLRAAQQALLEFDLDRVIADCFKDKPHAEPQRQKLLEKLSTYQANLRTGPWRGIPIEVAAQSLKGFCMTGGLSDAYEAQLAAQSDKWPAPKVAWSEARSPTIGVRPETIPEVRFPAPGAPYSIPEVMPDVGDTRPRIESRLVPLQPQAWTRATHSSGSEPVAAAAGPIAEPARRRARSQTFSSSDSNLKVQTKGRSASDATDRTSREAAQRRAAALETLELEADAGDEEIRQAYNKINSSIAAASLSTTLTGVELDVYAQKKQALREAWDVLLSN